MKNSRSKKHENEEKPEGTFAGHFLKIEKSLGFSLTSGSSVIIITKRKVQFQQSSKKKKNTENTPETSYNTKLDFYILSLKI